VQKLLKPSVSLLSILLVFACQSVIADTAYDKSETVDNIQAYAFFKAGNYVAAKELWESLAARGNTTAMINLANLFQQGIGVDEDDQQALKFITQAAEKGDARAQYELGIEYEKGILLTRDIQQAAKWLLASAKQDNMDGQFAYGIMLLTAYGQGMQAASIGQQQQALEWLTKAKQNGHPDAADYIKLTEERNASALSQ
jgi:TPR repeat protein